MAGLTPPYMMGPNLSKPRTLADYLAEYNAQQQRATGIPAGGSSPAAARRQEQNSLYNTGSPAHARRVEERDKAIRKAAAKKAAKPAAKKTTKPPAQTLTINPNPAMISYSPPRIGRVNPNQFKGKASQDVAFQLNGALNALIQQRNQINSEWADADTRLRQRQAQTDSDLSYLAGALSGQLQGIQKNTLGALDRGARESDANYAALQKDLATKNAEVDAAVAAETQRMGLTNGQPVELEARRNQDQDFIEGLAANNRSAAAALLKAQRGNYVQSSNETMANEAANMANMRAGARIAYDQDRNEVLKTRNRTLQTIAQKRQEIESQRNYLIQQRVDQMVAAAQEAAERQAQRDFQNQMAVNNFNLSSAKYESDLAYKNAQLRLSQGRLELDAKKAASKATTGDSKVGGLMAAQAYLANAGIDPAGRQILNDIFAQFDRGDAYQPGVTDNKAANKSAIQRWMRTELERTIPNDQIRVPLVGQLSTALDYYYGGY